MAYTNIDDPSAYFQTATYTGNGGSNRAVVNDGNSNLQPDWVWYKSRSHATSNILYDSSRGADYYLKSNTEAGEGSDANMFESFDSDGFSLNADSDGNASGRTYVGWQWKCNAGSTSSNTDGNITSTVQANTTAGFSIVTWTGDGSTSGKNVGHGLGAVPKMIISKDRDGTSNLPGWYIYHQAIGNQDHIQFTTGAKADSPTWGDTTPTSSVFSVGGEGAYIATNQNNIDYVAYVFADVQGYSKFGSYTGTGARANAPFVYTGFQPAFVMIKNADSTGSWLMFDNKRTIANGDMDYLLANTTGVEENSGLSFTDPIDFLSNGFKVLNYDAWANGSGTKYIYMAFAENPFVTSTGIPTTAR